MHAKTRSFSLPEHAKTRSSPLLLRLFPLEHGYTLGLTLDGHGPYYTREGSANKKGVCEKDLILRVGPLCADTLAPFRHFSDSGRKDNYIPDPLKEA